MQQVAAALQALRTSTDPGVSESDSLVAAMSATPMAAGVPPGVSRREAQQLVNASSSGGGGGAGGGGRGGDNNVDHTKFIAVAQAGPTDE